MRELASLLGAHPHTVRGWIKAGLPTVDRSRPVLVHGSEFQDWWGKRCKAAKRPLQPGQLYCLKCRAPKAPALGMVEYVAMNDATGNLKAICETCGTMMHRRVPLVAIAAVMPNLDVQRRQVPPRLIGGTRSSLNTDKAKAG